MTRQQMLDAINLKIARTANTEYSNIRTHYYLPVMIGDALDWIESQMKGEWTKWEPNTEYPLVFETIITKWHTKREPLDKQSDDCISYIYNLL